MIRKIAIINSSIDHPYRPGLKNWQEKLDFNNLRFISYSFSATYENKTSGIKILGSSSPGGKWKRILSFFLKWPLKTIKFIFFSNEQKGFKDKIRKWIEYAPLIVEKPDIIHLVDSGLFLKLEEFIINSKLVVTFRGGDIVLGPYLDDHWKNTLIDSIYKKADCLHFVSHYLCNEGTFWGADNDKCRVIYPGINTEFFNGNCLDENILISNDLIITTTARLSWQKGYLYALQAIKILRDKGFNPKYVILGDGNSYNELFFWTKTLGIENNIVFVGKANQDEVRNQLSKTTIYIQPSITESLCISVIEAMSMGLSVIASDVGGIPEIVLNGKNGILVPPADPQELAKAIEFLIKNPERRFELGRKAREYVVETFSSEREVSEWISLYRSLL